MKKKCILVICIALIAIVSGCRKQREEAIKNKWNLSIECAEESSPDKYIITYFDEEVITQTGALSFYNKNEFDITIHLSSNGEERENLEIPTGGSGTLKQLKKNTKYIVGVYADVLENTPINLMVYDGIERGVK